MKKLTEDGAMAGGPTNSAGGGAIAGIGIQSKDPNAPKNSAEPGVHPKKKKKDPRLTKDPMTRGSLKSFKAWTKSR